MGFRNPFRFSIKPNTGSFSPSAGDIGEIFVGDVGWDSYEELDIIKKAGTNFGWPVYRRIILHVNGYASVTTLNRDEPNPLFGVNGCTQQYFPFQKLIGSGLPQIIIFRFLMTHAVYLNLSTVTIAIRFIHNRPASGLETQAGYCKGWDFFRQ